MSTQLPITKFFGSKKRRAEPLEHKSKQIKSEPKLLKVSHVQEVTKNVAATTISRVETTPRKEGCDIRSFMTSPTPYRPECQSKTPIKFIQMEVKKAPEVTPMKIPGSILKQPTSDRPQSAVKKSIRFEALPEKMVVAESTAPPVTPDTEETDDIIKAANELVEKMKNKSKTLATMNKDKAKKNSLMTAEQLKKKLSRSAKLSELKSSLNKLGQQANELIQLEKKKKEVLEPKLRKFESIEIEVPRSPHKGALASPVKSPAKPAFERFAHLVHRTGPSTAGNAVLPLPMGYQRLHDLFTATDTVCSMMYNRGELITFKKVKPAVQELTRKTFTERHVAQMASVLPEAFDFRQEKIRNFGSTSKMDRYELVITPMTENKADGDKVDPQEETNVKAVEKKKLTPKMLQVRRDLFQKALLEKTMEKHEEFLASLDPPIKVNRDQLTRWHPNFPVDLVADIPPVLLPEPPNVQQAPVSARDVLDRAKNILDYNVRMRNALEVASRAVEPSDLDQPTTSSGQTVVDGMLDPKVKADVDKRVAAHDPLKGISKSLLERIRAKQAAKALDLMRVTPVDEQELLLLGQLPDTARIVRTLFVDNQKGVLPWETVIEKIMFSSKRNRSKDEVKKAIERLTTEFPDWINKFAIKGFEYLKLNRATPFAPIMEKLTKMEADKRRALS